MHAAMDARRTVDRRFTGLFKHDPGTDESVVVVAWSLAFVLPEGSLRADLLDGAVRPSSRPSDAPRGLQKACKKRQGFHGPSCSLRKGARCDQLIYWGDSFSLRFGHSRLHLGSVYRSDLRHCARRAADPGRAPEAVMTPPMRAAARAAADTPLLHR